MRSSSRQSLLGDRWERRGGFCLEFLLQNGYVYDHVVSLFLMSLGNGSAKKGSAIDVRIDDAGSILKFRIGFSL